MIRRNKKLVAGARVRGWIGREILGTIQVDDVGSVHVMVKWDEARDPNWTDRKSLVLL